MFCYFRESAWQYKKQELIAHSDKMSCDIENIDKTIEDLTKQLREGEKPEVIETKIELVSSPLY